MVKSNSPDFEYIMLIDTEGLLSVEKSDDEYDRRLILFCLAVSHLVIVNVVGEVTATLMKMLILCKDSLQKLGVNKVHRPTVHVILNQKANPDAEMNKAAINKIKEELKKVNLDQEIELNDNTFHILPSAFKKERFPDDKTPATLLRTDPDFIENVQRLCACFVSTATKSLEQTREQFSDPLRWIQFAATVLDILRKFPDMTYFNDIREREQDDLMREFIRKILEMTFTAKLRQELLGEAIEQSVKEIKTIIELKFQELSEKLTIELRNQLKLAGAVENVRKRSETFMNAQISSLLRAWVESAIMKNERYRLDDLVTKGETQFHDLIQKTIETSGQLTEKEAAIKFDEMWNTNYPRIASTFEHNKQVESALQFVYRNYHIFEKSNLPDIRVLLPLLRCIPRSTEATPDTPRAIIEKSALETNDMQVLDIIRKECIKDMSSHTPIQELPFRHDGTAEYNRKTIEKFKYFYVPTLISEYDKYYNGKKVDIWSREFHLNLRRSILAKDSAPALHKEQSGIWKQLLHVGRSFDRLVDITLSVIILKENRGRRPVDIDLIQQLVGMILAHIKEINNELDIFKLAASKHYQAMMHTCTVLLLAKFHYDEQWRFFDDVLSKVREQKPGWRAYFIAMVTQDRTADPKFADDVVKAFLKSVVRAFSTKAKEAIEEQVELDTKTLDRLSLLNELDMEVVTMTEDELYAYMKTPRDALIKRFEKRWKSTKAAIELKIEQLKQEHTTIIIQFFQLLHVIQHVLKQHKADKPTFISELFTTSGTSTDMNIRNKGRCVSLLLYAYFSRQNPIPRQFRVFNHDYSLSPIGTQMIELFPPPSEEVKAILSTMADKFNSTSILNLAIFINTCLDQQSITVNNFEDQSKTILSDLNNFLDRLKEIFDSKQCRDTCPCCNRICDVDHKQKNREIPPGGLGNLHSCQVGHQYRAFAGVKYEKKNKVNSLFEASVQRCEEIIDLDILRIVNLTDRISWADYKLKHKDWDWDFKLQSTSASSSNLTTNLPTIWIRIGKRWCNDHDMHYVTSNTKEKVDSNHYIFLLDGSGSMAGCRWKFLMDAVRGFINIRKKAVTDDLATLIVFNGSTTTPLDLCKEIKALTDNDLSILERSGPGGGTSFEAAFKKTIELLTYAKGNDKVGKLPQIIIFMTDGESHYPQQEIGTLSTTYRAMIKEFWTMPCETNNHTVLNQINLTMKGTFKDIKKAEDLMQAYAEIALR